MKPKILGLLVLTMVLGVCLCGPAMAIPTASLNLVGSPSAVGDLFEVEVWVDGDDIGLDLLGFGFDVSFDSIGIFDYTGYTIESGFDDDSFGPGNVAGSAFPGIAEDDVLLATLSFETLALGTDTLHVLGEYDGMFAGLFYELADPPGYDIEASLTISTESAPVPEPSTLLLIGSSLLCLAAMGRRFSRSA